MRTGKATAFLPVVRDRAVAPFYKRLASWPRCFAQGSRFSVTISKQTASPRAGLHVRWHQIFHLMGPEGLGNPRDGGELRRQLIQTAGDKAERHIIAEQDLRDRKRRLAARAEDNVEHCEIEAFVHVGEGIRDGRCMKNLGIDFFQHDPFEVDGDDGFIFEN
ncbi:hypothetical protein VQ045_16855 [Aurantimonas sp. E1-2-R+4]|uniref:hypothetical protein n=1 Tax=Aurantimonas sp. E1-2-R+4 TaxID=3113714 RepID=UPI002F959E0D